ncbi:MAG: hypothetical protein IJ551_09375 [Prevotella sp.]|nr:hypothetical protein [Prevotella sp.]
MDNFYKGDEVKFAINLEAPGFSMDDDDFEIEVKSGNTSVKGYKGEQAGASSALIIFKETVTPPVSDTQEGSDNEEEGQEENVQEPTPVTTWYAIVDTKTLAVGTMRVIATARIVDAKANDGVRDNIAVATLGKLIDP